MANIEKLPDINALDVAVGQMAGEMSRLMQHLGGLSPLGLQRLVESLELVAEAAKAERTKRVMEAGGRLEVSEREELREVERRDKLPNPKRFVPLLSSKGLKAEDGCIVQVSYIADPAKIQTLVARGKLTLPEVEGCKRTWKQIRKVTKGEVNEVPADGE